MRESNNPNAYRSEKKKHDSFPNEDTSADEWNRTTFPTYLDQSDNSKGSHSFRKKGSSVDEGSSVMLKYINLFSRGQVNV